MLVASSACELGFAGGWQRRQSPGIPHSKKTAGDHQASQDYPRAAVDLHLARDRGRGRPLAHRAGDPHDQIERPRLRCVHAAELGEPLPRGRKDRSVATRGRGHRAAESRGCAPAEWAKCAKRGSGLLQCCYSPAPTASKHRRKTVEAPGVEFTLGLSKNRCETRPYRSTPPHLSTHAFRPVPSGCTAFRTVVQSHVHMTATRNQRSMSLSMSGASSLAGP